MLSSRFFVAVRSLVVPNMKALLFPHCRRVQTAFRIVLSRTLSIEPTILNDKLIP